MKGNLGVSVTQLLQSWCGGDDSARVVRGLHVGDHHALDAGIEDADAVVVATDGDNTNIVIGQLATERFGVARVVVRLLDPARAEFYRRRGMHVVCPTESAIRELTAAVLTLAAGASQAQAATVYEYCQDFWGCDPHFVAANGERARIGLGWGGVAFGGPTFCDMAEKSRPFLSVTQPVTRNATAHNATTRQSIPCPHRTHLDRIIQLHGSVAMLQRVPGGALSTRLWEGARGGDE